jgi:hypothetical protein
VRIGRVAVWLLAGAAVVAVVRRSRRRAPVGDAVPPQVRRQDAMVDLASDDSFPASDPPSYWGRETEA